MSTENMGADRPRARRGFVLWIASTAVMVLSVVAGAAIALSSGEGLGVLVPIWLPLYASIVYAPLALVALIETRVSVRRHGAAAVHDTLATVGSVNNALIVPVLALLVFFV